MLVREREDRNQRAAVLLIAHQRRPCPSTKSDPAQETLRPVIGGILALLIGYQKWREHIAWLATLARDHEFTFLDHALKSGDSLVGFEKEAAAAPTVALAFAARATDVGQQFVDFLGPGGLS